MNLAVRSARQGNAVLFFLSFTIPPDNWYLGLGSAYRVEPFPNQNFL
jgi:hypothetical protein